MYYLVFLLSRQRKLYKVKVYVRGGKFILDWLNFVLGRKGFFILNGRIYPFCPSRDYLVNERFYPLNKLFLFVSQQDILVEQMKRVLVRTLPETSWVKANRQDLVVSKIYIRKGETFIHRKLTLVVLELTTVCLLCTRSTDRAIWPTIRCAWHSYGPQDQVITKPTSYH